VYYLTARHPRRSTPIRRWKVVILVGFLLVVAAIGGESIGGRTAQAATVRTWTGAAGKV